MIEEAGFEEQGWTCLPAIECCTDVIYEADFPVMFAYTGITRDVAPVGRVDFTLQVDNEDNSKADDHQL
jgi:hypothetical protein